jgi:hypothetical protein
LTFYHPDRENLSLCSPPERLLVDETLSIWCLCMIHKDPEDTLKLKSWTMRSDRAVLGRTHSNHNLFFSVWKISYARPSSILWSTTLEGLCVEPSTDSTATNTNQTCIFFARPQWQLYLATCNAHKEGSTRSSNSSIKTSSYISTRIKLIHRSQRMERNKSIGRNKAKSNIEMQRKVWINQKQGAKRE